LTWEEVIDQMKDCSGCQSLAGMPLLKVSKPPPTFNPPNPKEVLPRSKPRTLFISEAPPGGGNYGSFFWNETKSDRLRDQLLKACYEAGRIKEQSLNSFASAGFYLMPTVPAASSRLDKWNVNPSAALLVHSAKTHLALILRLVKPASVVLLGKSALDAAYVLFASSSKELKSDFESRKNPQALCRSHSPYRVSTGERELSLFCSYWPRRGKNHFNKLVEDLSNRIFRS
jgi:uracil-DNA glycosylase